MVTTIATVTDLAATDVGRFISGKKTPFKGIGPACQRRSNVWPAPSLIGGNGQRRFGSLQDVLDDLTVMNPTAGHGEIQRPPLAIDAGVDFRGAAATADADRLIFLPPFSPLAARFA